MVEEAKGMLAVEGGLEVGKAADWRTRIEDGSGWRPDAIRLGCMGKAPH
jgi:hypothetical protein